MLEKVQQGFSLRMNSHPGGARHYKATSCFLSAAMMLDWLAERSRDESPAIAARKIERAIDEVFSCRKALPFELGGSAGTRALRDAVLSNL